MKLPGLFSAQPSSSPHRFFVVYFGEHAVRAGLWQVVNQDVEILTTSSPIPWKEESALVDATDHALQQLGKESEEVKQTLFALEPTWVNQQGILADKKPLFQQITRELALEAVGFVVIPEAIIQDQLHRTGTSLQCFVIEVLVERVSISIVKKGKLGQQEMVGRSANVVDDIKEGFARFHETPLPSTVLLYSDSAVLTADELEECRQRLLELDLVSQFHFIQQPSFEVISAEEIMGIILQTGGRAVAESQHLIDPAQPAQSVEEVLEEEEKFPTEKQQLTTTALAVEPTLDTEAEEVVEDMEKHSAQSSSQQTLRQPLALLEKVPQHPVLFAAIGVLLGILLLFFIFTIASASMMTTQVNVELKKDPLSKQLILRLDPQVAVSDPTTGVLKAEVVKQTVSGEKSTETTGKKLIGDKAKGKVTLFNRTSSTKTFPAGTVLASGKLKYLLDQGATIASASTGRNFETNPGTLDASVTAADIGENYNLAKDTELTIDTFAKDTYIARIAAALSGGTSREIQAVSKKDQDTLLAALKSNLNKQAIEQLQSQAGNGKYVFPTNKIKVTSSKFSADVGKETTSLSLQLSIEAEALSYSATELQNLASQVISSGVPNGFSVSKDDIQLLTEPANAASNSAQVNVNAHISAVARPNITANDWKKEIAGKDEKVALNTLQQKQEIAKVTIVRQPALFARLMSTLPSDPTKIEIIVH